MPMIDVYAVARTFSEKHRLIRDLAKAVMKRENVPPIWAARTSSFSSPMGRGLAPTFFAGMCCIQR